MKGGIKHQVFLFIILLILVLFLIAAFYTGLIDTVKEYFAARTAITQE